MSAKSILVPLCALVLLAATSPAQGEQQEVERLKQTNTALLQKLNTQRRKIAVLEVRLAKFEAEKAAQAAAAKKAAELRGKILQLGDPVAQPAGQPARQKVQRVQFLNRARQIAFVNGQVVQLGGAAKPVNPLLQGDYKVALDKFDVARKKLDAAKDPAEARKIVDELNVLLLDARRALWERDQAKKATQTEKANAAGDAKKEGSK